MITVMNVNPKSSVNCANPVLTLLSKTCIWGLWVLRAKIILFYDTLWCVHEKQKPVLSLTTADWYDLQPVHKSFNIYRSGGCGRFLRHRKRCVLSLELVCEKDGLSMLNWAMTVVERNAPYAYRNLSTGVQAEKAPRIKFDVRTVTEPESADEETVTKTRLSQISPLTGPTGQRSHISERTHQRTWKLST